MQLHEMFEPNVDNSMKDSGQVIYPSNLKYTLQFTTQLVPNSLLVIRLGFEFPITHSKCFNGEKLCAGKDKDCLLEMGFGHFGGHLACSLGGLHSSVQCLCFYM